MEFGPSLRGRLLWAGASATPWPRVEGHEGRRGALTEHCTGLGAWQPAIISCKRRLMAGVARCREPLTKLQKKKRPMVGREPRFRLGGIDYGLRCYYAVRNYQTCPPRMRCYPTPESEYLNINCGLFCSVILIGGPKVPGCSWISDLGSWIGLSYL